jgi:hypothetical protein
MMAKRKTWNCPLLLPNASLVLGWLYGRGLGPQISNCSIYLDFSFLCFSFSLSRSGFGHAVVLASSPFFL